MQASNLSSEKGDKEEKETTRMGLLTFDVNPELEEDKQVYLAAVDDQAEQHGVCILYYHCNNRQFADNAFKNSCSAKGQ